MPSSLTPIGTAVFPHLNTADTKFDEKGVFSTSLRLTPDEAAPMIKSLEQVYSSGYKKICGEKNKATLKKADMPWSKETDRESGEETGNYLFKFKMKAETRTGIKMRPVLFDAKCQPMEDNIGAGSKMKVAFDPSCWHVAALGVGISLRLKGVQVLELVEYSGRSADSLGFGEEDGFETTSAALDSSSPFTSEHDDSTKTADGNGDF